jgi:hypothetical protein
MNNLFKYFLFFILLEIAIVVSDELSILLLGDSLTIGYTQPKQKYHSYGIELKKDFENGSQQADVK